MLESALAACLMIASHNYSVPPAVMVGIWQIEGGKVGQEVGPNKNGTYDLGPMQINTLWLPELARHWGVSKATARKWVRDDACTNFEVAAWILRQKIDQTGNLTKGIQYYHSATPRYGNVYKQKVINVIYDAALVK